MDVHADDPKTDVLRTGSSDGAWLRAVLVFNVSPAAYAHPSWLPSGSLSSVHSSRVARRQLSDALIAEHGLDDCFDWSLSSPVLRPMLLSPASWTELALTVGVLAHRAALRQVVKRDQLAQWSALLGDRMDFLWADVAERIPAAPTVSKASPSTATVAAMIDDGQAVLLALLNPQHDFAHANVLRRTQLRLPRARLSDPSAWYPEVTQPHALAESLMDDVLPRRSSRWTWLSGSTRRISP